MLTIAEFRQPPQFFGSFRRSVAAVEVGPGFVLVEENGPLCVHAGQFFQCVGLRGHQFDAFSACSFYAVQIAVSSGHQEKPRQRSLGLVGKLIRNLRAEFRADDQAAMFARRIGWSKGHKRFAAFRSDGQGFDTFRGIYVPAVAGRRIEIMHSQTFPPRTHRIYPLSIAADTGYTVIQAAVDLVGIEHTHLPGHRIDLQKFRLRTDIKTVPRSAHQV